MLEQGVSVQDPQPITDTRPSRLVNNKAFLTLGILVSGLLVACSGSADNSDPMDRVIPPSSALVTTTTSAYADEPVYTDENCGRPQQVDCDTYFGGAAGGTGTLPPPKG